MDIMDIMNMVPPPKKIYAVRAGHKQGFFAKWSDCEPQVKSFSHASYKGFKTREQAEFWYETGLDKEFPFYAAVIEGCGYIFNNWKDWLHMAISNQLDGFNTEEDARRYLLNEDVQVEVRYARREEVEIEPEEPATSEPEPDTDPVDDIKSTPKAHVKINFNPTPKAYFGIDFKPTPKTYSNIGFKLAPKAPVNVKCEPAPKTDSNIDFRPNPRVIDDDFKPTPRVIYDECKPTPKVIYECKPTPKASVNAKCEPAPKTYSNIDFKPTPKEDLKDEFKPNLKVEFNDDFNRYAKTRNWNREQYTKNKIEAIEKEIERIYCTLEDRELPSLLQSLQRVAAGLGKPVRNTLEEQWLEFKRAPYFNIIELINAARQNRPPRLFRTLEELGEFTFERKGRAIHQEVAEAGSGLLAAFLQDFSQPPLTFISSIRMAYVRNKAAERNERIAELKRRSTHIHQPPREPCKQDMPAQGAQGRRSPVDVNSSASLNHAPSGAQAEREAGAGEGSVGKRDQRPGANRIEKRSQPSSLIEKPPQRKTWNQQLLENEVRRIEEEKADRAIKQEDSSDVEYMSDVKDMSNVDMLDVDDMSDDEEWSKPDMSTYGLLAAAWLASELREEDFSDPEF